MLEKIRGMTAFGMRMVESVLPERRILKELKWGLRQGAELIEPKQLDPMAPRAEGGPETTEAQAPAPQGPPAIDARTLRTELERSTPPLLIDIREPTETQNGVIPGALLIPMGTVLGSIGEIRQADRPVVVYCGHGVRSANIAVHLRDRGIEVFTLTGGIEAWRESGGAVVAPPVAN